MPLPKSIGPTSNFYWSQRLRLHYLDWGNHDAPPLILLHGGLDHGRSWDPVALDFKDDWHVIVPELRGHGDSDWASDGDYTMAAYVYDLAQLIHQQKARPSHDRCPFTRRQHFTLRYAGTYPDNVRKLVAIEGLGASPSVLAERAEKTAGRTLCRVDRPQARPVRTPAAPLSEPRRGGGPHAGEEPVPDPGDGRSSDPLRRQPERGRHVLLEVRQLLRAWPPSDFPQADIEYLWGRITCPTLLVYGEESWASNPEQDGRLAKFNTAKLEMYANAGHWVHHDRYVDFVRSLKAFL